MSVIRRMQQLWSPTMGRPQIQAGDNMYVFRVHGKTYKAYCKPRESMKVFRALIQQVLGHTGEIRGAIPESIGRYAKSSQWSIKDITNARWVRLIRVQTSD